MTKGILSIQIAKPFKEQSDQDIERNFVGIFLANHMNRFIDYKTMISEKKRKYPFMIENKDSSNKESTHCLSIMDIDPKIDLLFLLI